jgi:hypothetical protein
MNLILLIGGIGPYVFGAVWESNVTRKSNQQAVEEGDADTTVEVKP